MAGAGRIATGVIYCDENLARLASFPADSVDLIYLDPPFFSNRKYEVIWGDEAELRSFEDRWEGGVNVYVQWMRERAIELQRVLKPTGTVYLHCDWHAVHYLKVMMDEVFGRENFINEIIWYYGPKATQRISSFQRKHDVILMYGKKAGQHTFNVLLQEYGAGSLAERGTRYAASDQQGPYRLTTRRTKDGSKIRAKVHLRAGVAMTDVWEIPVINATSNERVGYPTQKPVALLDRIIRASSNPGDLVLDPFCGCGTTVVAADQLGRHWVGIDISPTACDLIQRRLAKNGVAVRVENMPATEEALRAVKPFEFQNMVIGAMNGTHAPRKSGDMGIDGYSWFEHLPIQVKQSDAVGRNVVDNFETAIERTGGTAGYIVAFSFTRGAREEVARARAAKGTDIRLVRVTELFKRTRTSQTPLPADLMMPPRLEVVPEASELVESIRRKLAEAADTEPTSPTELRSPRRSRRDLIALRPSRESADSD